MESNRFQQMRFEKEILNEAKGQNARICKD